MVFTDKWIAGVVICRGEIALLPERRTHSQSSILSLSLNEVIGWCPPEGHSKKGLEQTFAGELISDIHTTDNLQYVNFVCAPHTFSFFKLSS